VDDDSHVIVAEDPLVPKIINNPARHYGGKAMDEINSFF
jgi:hypothetical protein